MKTLLSLFFAVLCSVASAQMRVNVLETPVEFPTQLIFAPSSTQTYICVSKPSDSPVSVSIASATNANPVVFTVSAGHGVDIRMSPTVIVSGGTGSWAAVNGTFKVTYLSSTTFSIPVNSTSLGAMAGSLVAATNAPLTNKPMWAVKSVQNDGAGNVSSAWAVGGANNICSNRATLSYQ